MRLCRTDDPSVCGPGYACSVAEALPEWAGQLGPFPMMGICAQTCDDASDCPDGGACDAVAVGTTARFCRR